MKDSPCYQCADLDGPTDGAAYVVCSACVERWQQAKPEDFYPWVVQERERQLAALGQVEAKRPSEPTMTVERWTG